MRAPPQGSCATLRRPGNIYGTYHHGEHLLVLAGDPGAYDRHRSRSRGLSRRGGRMTPIAPLMTTFLREHMPMQKGYSPHSCEAYAYSFKLLFEFASNRIKT